MVEDKIIVQLARPQRTFSLAYYIRRWWRAAPRFPLPANGQGARG